MFKFSRGDVRELLRILSECRQSRPIAEVNTAENRAAARARGNADRVAIKHFEPDVDDFLRWVAEGVPKLRAREQLLKVVIERLRWDSDIPTAKSESAPAYKIFMFLLTAAGHGKLDCHDLLAKVIGEIEDLPHLKHLLVTPEERDAYVEDLHTKALDRRRRAMRAKSFSRKNKKPGRSTN
jgi:hypothetical protein